MVGRILNNVIDEYKDVMFNSEFPEAESILNKFNGWSFIRFVPINQKNCRNTVRNNSQYLYHITEISSIENIINNGLILNNLSHPENKPRIFMITCNRSDLKQKYNISFNYDNYIDGLARRICQYRTGTFKTNWKYAIIKIDIDRIPNNIPLYWDIYSFPFAVFTENDIPSDAIIDYKIMSLK